jgi:hypothetical protein
MMGMCEQSNGPLGTIKSRYFCTATVIISFTGRFLHHELNTS